MDETGLTKLKSLVCSYLRFLGRLLLLWQLWCGADCVAAEFVEDFDDLQSGKTTWRARYDKNRCTVVGHARVPRAFRGAGCEFLGFRAADSGAQIEMLHKLPRTQVLRDTHLSVWVRSNRTGARLSVRLILPHQVDTTTNQTPLILRFEGDTYTKEGEWQELRCDFQGRRLRRLIGWARQYYGTDIDVREMYLDRVYLTSGRVSGPLEYRFDELRLGPLVPAKAIRPVNRERERSTRSSPAKFRHDQLLVEGEPTFLRILPYHGEDPAELAGMGWNVLWVPEFQDEESRAVIRDIRKAGPWVIAIPPQARSADAQTVDAKTVSLAPFGEETDGILAWNLGTGIPPEDKNLIKNWIEQLRDADRHFNRPLMGDVAGLYRPYSRMMSMVGVSQEMLHTHMNPKEYRDDLLAKQNLALPGKYIWTWVATEPAPELELGREAAGYHPVVIEPEQIRMLVYLAVQAGNRGIGFMKTASLNEKRPGSRELKLVLKQLLMELKLIEPWLATGTVRSHISFNVRMAKPKLRQSNTFGNSAQKRQETNAWLRENEDQKRQERRLGRELEAAAIETADGSTLIVMQWMEEGAQFVPGRQAGVNATIKVPGPESSVAYLITTTGVRSLDGQSVRKAGGWEITLKNFDQTAIVLLTSNHRVKQELDRKVAAMAAESATVTLQLAQAKLERIEPIDRELVALGVPQVDGKELLSMSALSIERGVRAFRQKDFHRARLRGQEAMQLMRRLQRAHWNDAVRSLSSPVSSEHTLCFQTLPDYWRMIARLGSDPTAAENLLRSGEIEDIDTMIAEGWQHKQRLTPGIKATAELSPSPFPKGGRYSLRLAAWAADPEEVPRSVPEPPVSVITPSLNVHSGELVHISGWIRMSTSIHGSSTGVTFFDSLAGPERGLRWHKADKWQYFELIREVPVSGPMTMTMSLTGMGEVYFDQLRVVVQKPSLNRDDVRGRKLFDPRTTQSGPRNRKRMQEFSDQQAKQRKARLKELEEEELFQR